MKRSTIFLALIFFPASRIVAAHTAKPEKVALDLHVMSMCPYGVQAENGIFPAVASLKDFTDLRLFFIADKSTPAAGGTPEFRSMHGQKEVDEDLRQLCVMEHFPEKFMVFILERNKSINDSDWQKAASLAGISSSAVQNCSGGAEGAALLSKSLEFSIERKAGASPTIYVDSIAYNGSRSLRSITLAICDALKGKGILRLPAACSKAENMPPETTGSGGGCGDNPVEFDALAVVETGCKFCGATLAETIKQIHPGVNIRIIDAGSKEGEGLIKQYDARVLPLYVLDKKVEHDPNFQNLLKVSYAKSHDNYLILPGQGNYTPSVQLRRKRAPGQIDVFVKSLSPVTTAAEAEFLKFLTETKASDLTFSFHYITQAVAAATEAPASPGPASGKAAGVPRRGDKAGHPASLTADKGDLEIDEDIRQICIFQHASIDNFFTYLNCRNQNLDDTMRASSCIEKSETITKCIASGEGLELLRQDASLIRELEIKDGPAFLWENRYGPFGWNEADWKSMISGVKQQ
ncbi:MAG: hypothetical protein NTX59_11820 [Elusimicrobia bacterium]|nr:hypothetical protein [Elusimicrobiota bacterium]